MPVRSANGEKKSARTPVAKFTTSAAPIATHEKRVREAPEGSSGGKKRRGEDSEGENGKSPSCPSVASNPRAHSISTTRAGGMEASFGDPQCMHTGREQIGTRNEEVDTRKTFASDGSHRTPLLSHVQERLRMAIQATPCLPSLSNSVSFSLSHLAPLPTSTTAMKPEKPLLPSQLLIREEEVCPRHPSRKEGKIADGDKRVVEPLLTSGRGKSADQRTHEGVMEGNHYGIQARVVVPSPVVENMAMRRRRDSSFLSAALHAVYLVTMIDKAQRGRNYHAINAFASTRVPGSGTVAPCGDGFSSLPSSMPLASVLVNGRWLDGVSQVLQGSQLSMDDLAGLAQVFPQWLRIKWSRSSHRHPTTLSSFSGKESLTSPYYPVSSSSSSSLETSSLAATNAALPPPVLQARVYLTGDHVISEEEAETFLQSSMFSDTTTTTSVGKEEMRSQQREGEDKGGAATGATRAAYRTTVERKVPSSLLEREQHPLHGEAVMQGTQEVALTSSSHGTGSPSLSSATCQRPPWHGGLLTAYQAYLSQHPPPPHQQQEAASPLQKESESQALKNENLLSSKGQTGKSEEGGVPCTFSSSISQNGKEEAERLLSQTLSPELRQSLSQAKLAHVLQQLQKDISGEEEKRYKEIGRRRVLEDLLRTYTRIRSVIRRRAATAIPLLSRRSASSLFLSSTKKHISLAQLMMQLQADNDHGRSSSAALLRRHPQPRQPTSHTNTVAPTMAASRWSVESEVEAENLHLLKAIEELVRIPSSGLCLQKIDDREEENAGSVREDTLLSASSPPSAADPVSSSFSLTTIPLERWHRVILCFDQDSASAKDLAAAVEAR